MGKTKTIFLSSDVSELDFEMQCYANYRNEIYISIENKNDDFMTAVCLDLQTAIKFVKHLKREIALIKESEVNNG